MGKWARKLIASTVEKIKKINSMAPWICTPESSHPRLERLTFLLKLSSQLWAQSPPPWSGCVQSPSTVQETTYFAHRVRVTQSDF